MRLAQMIFAILFLAIGAASLVPEHAEAHGHRTRLAYVHHHSRTRLAYAHRSRYGYAHGRYAYARHGRSRYAHANYRGSRMAYAHRGRARVAYRDGRPRAWCGWWMRTQKGGGPEYNLAANWRHWGHQSGPQVGAVVVWPHHVGMITGRTAGGEWIVKSGNDGGAVRERPRSVAGAVFRI